MLGQGEIYLLKGVIQHYSWGGFSYIPNLLQTTNPESRPWAEYWLGAHPNHSSTIVGQSELPLASVLTEDLEEGLGAEVAKKFGGLPYLFKVLDVRQMLSIQVHPDKSSASKKYDEENAQGIPLTASHRNYKDRNHKPEMMMALSDFWLLHGFKSKAQISETLATVPELESLSAHFKNNDLRALYEYVMQMDQATVNAILEPLSQRILPLYKNDTIPKNAPDFWAARAIETFCRNGNYDRGIFSIYLFNLVYLAKGEGIFQSEGLPHAYLEGQNVEVMANSDNVLRAGLTDKHIDVNELLQHVSFVETYPNILTVSDSTAYTFDTPAEEFKLTQYQLEQGKEQRRVTSSVEIILVIHGELEISAGSHALLLSSGNAAVISRSTNLTLHANANTLAYCVASGFTG